jgi:rod shape-determining protein MreD
MLIRFLFALLLMFAALSQATFMPQAHLIQVIPDVTLVLLLVWSALRGVPEGMAYAFGLGIFLDVLALDPLGTNALALLPVALIGGMSRKRFFHSNLVFPLLLSVVATIAHAVVLLLLRSTDGIGVPFPTVIRFIFLQSLLNAIFVPPLYLIAGWMERRMDTRHA